MKFPYYTQLEANDCGATCIRMVTSFFNREYTLRFIKDKIGIARQGVSALDIVACLNRLGFDAHVVIISLTEILKMPLPAILFWRENHFVVLYKVEQKKNKNYFRIADPAYGKIKLPEEEFIKSWIINGKGVSIISRPNKNEPIINSSIEKEQNSILKLAGLFLVTLKRHKIKIILSLFLMMLSLFFNILTPIYYQKMIDLGVLNGNMNLVSKFMLSLLSFFFGYTISNSISNIILTKVNFDTSIVLLSEYLGKLIKLPLSFFDTRLNTDLMQRMDDQTRLQNFLTNHCLTFINAIMSIVVFSSLLLYYNTLTFMFFLSISICSLIWTYLFMKKRKRLDYERFYLSSENKNNIFELINGMSEIKINSAQNKVISNWEYTQNKLNNIAIKALYLNYYQIVGSSFFYKIRDFIILGFCGFLVISGNLTLGVMMTISYILGLLSSPMEQLTYFTQNCQDASNSLERLEEIQKKENEVKNIHLESPSIKSGIKLSNISFKYHLNSNNYVIHNLSLFIAKGEITAIVGVSGSGKTTLLKLLLSFYYPQEGDIFIDNFELNRINPDSWRSNCGVVMQDGFIFSGSIIENIAFGQENVNFDKVKEAAIIACIDDFVNSLPMQYETKIGKAGIDISGGQKQRILIARAIYKNPQFIFLDEATSALDAENERNILKNLAVFLKGKTVIIIAHRLSTVKNADKIVVMEKGCITEIGSHHSLSQKKGVYFHLIKNQLELGT